MPLSLWHVQRRAVRLYAWIISSDLKTSQSIPKMSKHILKALPKLNIQWPHLPSSTFAVHVYVCVERQRTKTRVRIRHVGKLLHTCFKPASTAAIYDLCSSAGGMRWKATPLQHRKTLQNSRKWFPSLGSKEVNFCILDPRFLAGEKKQ